jgi:hypothetical protein
MPYDLHWSLHLLSFQWLEKSTLQEATTVYDLPQSNTLFLDVLELF